MMMRALSAFAAAALTAAPAFAQGTWSQADAYYGAAEMDEARRAVQAGAGDQRYGYLQGERFEIQTNEGEPVFLWDLNAWYGGDLNKVWLKSEGEYALEADDFEEAEIQALYSRAVTSYFDVQAGVRQDLAGGDKPTYAVLGLQGLAPYWFHVDLASFLSDEGDLTARLEAEYDLRITQRLILAPRAELELSAQDIPELGVGAGVSKIHAGLRLRYEIRRQFAPYIGVAWARHLGDTADFARADGEDVEAASVVAGIRFWF